MGYVCSQTYQTDMSPALWLLRCLRGLSLVVCLLLLGSNCIAAWDMRGIIFNFYFYPFNKVIDLLRGGSDIHE